MYVGARAGVPCVATRMKKGLPLLWPLLPFAPPQSVVVARARRRWYLWVAAALALAVVAVVLLLAASHGANLHARFAALAQQRQQNGARVWEETCHRSLVNHPPELVRCADAKIDAEMDVDRVALEQTLSAVLLAGEAAVAAHLGWLNPVRWFVQRCGAGSTCHYVLWKCLDTLVSDMWIYSLAIALALLLALYVCWFAPVRSRQQLDHALLLERSAKREQGGGEMAVDLTPPPAPAPTLTHTNGRAFVADDIQGNVERW